MHSRTICTSKNITWCCREHCPQGRSWCKHWAPGCCGIFPPFHFWRRCLASKLSWHLSWSGILSALKFKKKDIRPRTKKKKICKNRRRLVYEGSRNDLCRTTLKKIDHCLKSWRTTLACVLPNPCFVLKNPPNETSLADLLYSLTTDAYMYLLTPLSSPLLCVQIVLQTSCLCDRR